MHHVGIWITLVRCFVIHCDNFYIFECHCPLLFYPMGCDRPNNRTRRRIRRPASVDTYCPLFIADHMSVYWRLTSGVSGSSGKIFCIISGLG